jgi:Flp pilus assembly protein TadG
MGALRGRMRHERGQAMVELALVLPVLLTVLFATIQFGIAYNHYETVTDAARVGARKAAVSRTAPDPVAATAQAARNSAAGLDQTQLQVDVATAAWQPGNDVTVKVSYPYSIDVFGLALKSGQLTSTTTERIE